MQDEPLRDDAARGQSAMQRGASLTAVDGFPHALSHLSDATRFALYALRERQQGRTAALPHTMPLSLIGPREASDSQKHHATLIGAACAFAGLPVLCGGKSGVMEAGASGVRSVGGIVIGLLPEDDADAANPYLSVALPTGLGITRNALIARAALCLIAVGGGLGTLSEIALGRQWNKRVLTIDGAPDVAGAEPFDGVEGLLLCLSTDLVRSPRNVAVVV